MLYRPKGNETETPHVTAEKTQEREKEKSHQQKPQNIVYHPKKYVPGTRTPKQEDRRENDITSGRYATEKHPHPKVPQCSKSPSNKIMISMGVEPTLV